MCALLTAGDEPLLDGYRVIKSRWFCPPTAAAGAAAQPPVFKGAARVPFLPFHQKTWAFTSEPKQWPPEAGLAAASAACVGRPSTPGCALPGGRARAVAAAGHTRAAWCGSLNSKVGSGGSSAGMLRQSASRKVVRGQKEPTAHKLVAASEPCLELELARPAPCRRPAGARHAQEGGQAQDAGAEGGRWQGGGGRRQAGGEGKAEAEGPADGRAVGRAQACTALRRPVRWLDARAAVLW